MATRRSLRSGVYRVATRKRVFLVKSSEAPSVRPFMLAIVSTRDAAGGDKDEAPRRTGPQEGGASAVKDGAASAA